MNRIIVVTNPTQPSFSWDEQHNIWTLEIPREATADEINDYIKLLQRTPDWGDSDEADSFWNNGQEVYNSGD